MAEEQWPTPNGLDEYMHCKHCGRVIVWDDWSYVHLDGWANCRQADDAGELDSATNCEPLRTHRISPQPTSNDEARAIPIMKFVVGEDGTKHPWTPGTPMPTLSVHAVAAKATTSQGEGTS